MIPTPASSPRARAPRRNRRHSGSVGGRVGGSAGFTLVELVAALAIFALVAVMATQALNGALRQRDALAARDDAAAALGRSLALMRRDLEAALPLGFLPAGADTREPALRVIGDAPGGFALSIGGHPRLPGEPGAGMARVLWRVDPAREVLTRRHWPSLAPTRRNAGGPARDMLEDVTALAIAPLGEWDGQIEDPDALPPGFEVVLQTRRHGRLRLVVVR